MMLIVFIITKLCPLSSVHSTLVPFKASVTLVTTKVDTTGTVPLVESLVMLNKMFDIILFSLDWGDTDVTMLATEELLCGTVIVHCRMLLVA